MNLLAEVSLLASAILRNADLIFRALMELTVFCLGLITHSTFTEIKRETFSPNHLSGKMGVLAGYPSAKDNHFRRNDDSHGKQRFC